VDSGPPGIEKRGSIGSSVIHCAAKPTGRQRQNGFNPTCGKHARRIRKVQPKTL
jgi:hypothetical protein